MRQRPVILRRPATAQSLEGIISIILQILSVISALYNVFSGLFGGVR